MPSPLKGAAPHVGQARLLPPKGKGQVGSSRGPCFLHSLTEPQGRGDALFTPQFLYHRDCPARGRGAL